MDLNSQSSSPPYNPCNELGNTGDWSNTPAHIELIVDQKRAVHFLVKTSNHRLQYHQWDGDNHRSHTFGHGQLIGGAAMAVDGTHVHITRFVTLDTGGHAMNYEYSANSGITWTEALVKEGRDSAELPGAVRFGQDISSTQKRIGVITTRPVNPTRSIMEAR